MILLECPICGQGFDVNREREGHMVEDHSDAELWEWYCSELSGHDTSGRAVEFSEE